VSGYEGLADLAQDAPPCAWALAYATADCDIFPCAPNKHPLTPNGYLDATRHPRIIKAWWTRWPCADPALAVPGRIVVVDIDRRSHRDGFRDFARLTGCDPLSVETPIATTVSGGLHLYYAAARPYKNMVAIDGTSIDTRSLGGYAILPTGSNGRRWLTSLSTPLAPAPGWLDTATRQERPNSLFHRPAPPASPPASPSKGSLFGRTLLVRAVRLIMTAPQGAQEETRHRQAYFVGTLIAAGAVNYEVAYRALVAAANAMPAYGRPWRDLDEKVAASLARGMGQGP
jgi:Bifunctional DNA primase/polymerase, N-terminal